MTRASPRRYVPERSGFFRPFWQKQGTAVQGTWLWAGVAGQTNYASVTGEGAGLYHNETAAATLDEYKWSSIFLTKGRYKIIIIQRKNTDVGIAEVLVGTKSLDTKDLYSAVVASNQLWEITFTLTADQTADMRFRVNGKNASSSNYHVNFSCFQIEKVA